MANINGAVGWSGAVNTPQDVLTVQQLLNQVPPNQGAPAVQLAEDAICGPKTITAIQHFQLKHFGYQGADGRVDPEGQTLAKLNEFATPNPLAPMPLSVTSTMLCPHGSQVMATSLRNSTTLTTSDQFIVTGCPFVWPGGAPSPCMQVQWFGLPDEILSVYSQGMCLNVGFRPQGPVIIAAT